MLKGSGGGGDGGGGGAQRRLRLRVDDPPRRRHLVFMGAAVLADIMREQESFWVSKAEWAEDPHRALAKCGGGLGG